MSTEDPGTSAAPSAGTLHRPVHPIRFVTAASLFDGHDAAINIMRRILQSQGAEVIHLGHNRSVDDVVRAVVDEDVHGVAISSYQGGHMEYFTYLVDRLRQEGRGHVKVYGGGGGVIVAAEIEELHAAGVQRIFSPEDGQRLGLAAMVNTMIRECDTEPTPPGAADLEALLVGDGRGLARMISGIEAGLVDDATLDQLRAAPRVPVRRNHRNRGFGQVLADRRAHPAVPARPRGQAAHRSAGDRPHPAAGRRCPAR